jgi:hypothetical protein
LACPFVNHGRSSVVSAELHAGELTGAPPKDHMPGGVSFRQQEVELFRELNGRVYLQPGASCRQVADQAVGRETGAFDDGPAENATPGRPSILLTTLRHD